ncbi:hypothetical protein MF271_10595 [Deinococcus sp. KNUC1210]|uniref:hypothetical protein n=1 Tax=Deinococcus sp. KNUC1210 TaxID=2917691 RepID=UPI001EEFB2F2|nr:hypothetical protein [Deinococcus sp. KNUC1210]ULH14482.1 hypothetical protein MF271_10595 [Deinococcus sp. KNUC1210]
MFRSMTLDLVHARLADSSLPADVQREYLQVLTNLLVLFDLLGPDDDGQTGPQQAKLQQLYRNHLSRRTQLETEYPELVVVSRPEGWTAS